MMGRSNTDFEIFKEATLMPGAERLIRHLHRNNIPISIATSSYRTFYEVKITNHTELFSLFGENVICGDDPKIKNPKPHPDIFHCSRDLLDSTIKDEECLVFEDAINGVRSGVSAQMKVVWIPDARFIDIDNFPPDNYGAHEVINSLSDFIPEKYGLPPFQD
ncbi:putative pseudouridine-5'-phosphatase [Zancudomyces culisetae]|uniref:Putative pseudouridine-5'-phosphatase n=1 Tax=Zancudomyces culisetae TaxID=1213189 RepID=A0A1R1PSX7_ZANCU|nr:putative pseudouridine-5'-phosphatase [Zancudomyces culisetae]|eukprot:OMH84070.1 putative pseudouridine-5'-phosphatase [Zancudomyces culisetae]